MNSKYIKMMAMAAMAASAFTACKQEMDDWGTDSSFDRLFSPVSISISSNPDDATIADVEFSLPKGAGYFELELSTDSLYADMTEGSATMLNYKFEKSPAQATGLLGDTKYFVRFRSAGVGVNPSKWVYAASNDGKYFFKTPKEQIMKAVSSDNIGEDFVNVSWNPTPDVTHLLVSAKGKDDVKIALDAAAKEAGEYTVTGLNPSTAYTITIWFNETQRGSVSVSTFAAAPKADYIYRPVTLSAINDILIADIAEKAKAAAGSEEAYSATIVIPAGSTIDINGGTDESGNVKAMVLPDGMAVTFFGGAGDLATVKLSKSINLAGTHAYVRFENLAITDGGCQYIINQADACEIGELSFKDCAIKDVERSVVRTQGSNVQNYGLISFDNCIGTNLSSGNGYSMILIGQDKSIVNKVSLTNSTFNGVQRSFIESAKSSIAGGIVIDHCTLYNIVETGRYLIDANGMNTNITISNTILGKTHHASGAKGCRTKGSITVSNSIRTSDCVYAGNDILELPAGDQSSADIFTEPEVGNFTLKIGDKVGDPRWYRVEE